MIDMTGKVILVTGGSGGLGIAQVLLLRSAGATVVSADIANPKHQVDGVEYSHLDVTQADQWTELVSRVMHQHGRLNGLVQNAGIVTWGPLGEVTEAEFRRVIDVNVVGVFLGMSSIVQAMTESGGGSIVNISSTAGLTALPSIIAYIASKFAVRGMSKGAAVELAARGIRVNSVHPGIIDTVMTSDDSYVRPLIDAQPIKRKGEPGEIANMVAFLLSDASSYATGAEFIVDGGYTAM